MKRRLILGLLGIVCLSQGAVIRHAEEADQAVQFAAKDMARCLIAVTGEPYGVQSGGEARQGDIVLGTDASLRSQEWRLHARDGVLNIQGSSSPGIVYGIYAFLEKHASCLWPAPDTEVLPRQPGWAIPAIDEVGRPAFLRREMYVGDDYMDSIWRLRNKENHRASFCNLLVGSPKEHHTFDIYVKELKEPGLFGVTQSGDPCHTLCMTNPRVRELVLARLLANIEADREARKGQPDYDLPQIYDISQPDGRSGQECWCEECRKLAEAEGSYAGPNIAFVNYLADAIRDRYPDILLRTFAYSYTMKPPKTIRAAKNVIIQFCDSEIFRPLMPGTPNGDDLAIWGEHAVNKAVWSYWRIYRGTLFPFARPRREIAEELRFINREGVIHYFAENEAPLSRSFAMQQHWLMLKMLDNPNQDIFRLNERFFEAYYGKGAAPMLEYLDYLEKRQNLQRTHLDREFFEKVNGWLDAAEALAQDEPLARVHIGWERVIVDRTMYQNLNTLVQLGYHPDYAKVLARFKENLLAQLNGWSPLKTYRKLSARLAVAEQEADLYSHFPVKIPAQFEGCEVLDMHWSELKGEAVKDPDAVCGTARHNPKYKHEKPTYSIGFYNAQLRSGNGLHFTPENTPQDEKFHLYRLGRTRIITPLYIHYDNLWHYRQELSTIGILGEEREIWVSMKFAGPLYVQGSKSKNQVLFDRVLLVNDPNPLRRYKPLDPSRNLLANGGFETYSENRMEQWGQTTPQCGIDTEVKHSGNASLRIHNAPQNYASVRFSLGRIKDLKDDLLIRGWVKYANILSGPQYSMPILALWSINDQGKNSYSLPLMEFFPGTYDWHSFETVVKIEEFKASCNRHKVPPTKAQFHVGLYHQPGSLWVDDLEIIPLEKAK